MMSLHWSLATRLAAIGFGLWWLGICAVQCSTLYTAATGRRLPWLVGWKRWDLLRLCPQFTFFNWIPSVHYHLLYRDLFEVGRGQAEYTPWTLVKLPRRSSLRLVWNPQRRNRFVLEDACRALLAQLGRQLQPTASPGDVFEQADPACLALTCLRHYVACLPSSGFEHKRQLLIAQSKTGATVETTPIPLFVSAPFSAALGRGGAQ